MPWREDGHLSPHESHGRMECVDELVGGSAGFSDIEMEFRI